MKSKEEIKNSPEPKMIRVPMPHGGSATVTKNCPKDVLEALKKMAEYAYENL